MFLFIKLFLQDNSVSIFKISSNEFPVQNNACRLIMFENKKAAQYLQEIQHIAVNKRGQEGSLVLANSVYVFSG